MYVPNKEPGPHFFLIPLSKYKGKVPFIITDIFEQVQKLNSTEKEGVFRLSGQHNDVISLCKELDNGIVDWSKYDSNTIECSFKKYLENLSVFDPLIPESLEEEIETAIDKIPDDQIGKYYHDLISNNYSNLLSHRSTLATIFHFFSKVIQPNVEKNRMDPYNLSVCFFMLFFRRIENSINQKLLKPIQIFIEKFDEIFEESWYEPASNFKMSVTEIECLGAPLVDIEQAQIECQRRNYRKGSLIPYYVQDYIDPPKREAPKLQDP